MNGGDDSEVEIVFVKSVGHKESVIAEQEAFNMSAKNTKEDALDGSAFSTRLRDARSR